MGLSCLIFLFPWLIGESWVRYGKSLWFWVAVIGRIDLVSIEYLTWWPKEDYFNAVIKKLDYRKKFKGDNTVLSCKKPKSWRLPWWFSVDNNVLPIHVWVAWCVSNNVAPNCVLVLHQSMCLRALCWAILHVEGSLNVVRMQMFVCMCPSEAVNLDLWWTSLSAVSELCFMHCWREAPCGSWSRVSLFLESVCI